MFNFVMFFAQHLYLENVLNFKTSISFFTFTFVVVVYLVLAITQIMEYFILHPKYSKLLKEENTYHIVSFLTNEKCA